MPSLELYPIQGPNKSLPGFRLRRLEMFNWGTFNGKAYAVVPDGRWTLLVGENGSGKSTAVDALRTLLVPPSRLNYNDASGDQKRRDRTKRSYVRGAWASSSQDESSAPITQYLRGEGTYCVLLAVFSNERKGTASTIAQVLWEQGEDIRTLYVVAPNELSIHEHFSRLPNTRDVRKELRRRNFDPTDTFSAYSERLRNVLGIQSEGALQVFNHAIGVKEVRDINQFIREHMLEPSDALQFIDETLRPHYKTLQDCWEAIQKAEAQIKLLQPIAAFHEQIETATARRREFEELLEITPLFFANRHLELRCEEETALKSESQQLTDRKAELNRAEKDDAQKRDVVKSELDNDSVAPRLELIRIQLENLRKQHSEKRSRYDAIQESLAVLGLAGAVESESQFNQTRVRVNEALQLAKSEDEKWRRKVIGDEVALNKLREDLRQFSDELENLIKHRVLIPGPFMAIRDVLCTSLSIDPSDLPFSGELIEVKAAYREWTGAIERLLHSFGVSLLVPDRYYRVVAAAINSRHLGLRFVFHKVPAPGPVLFEQQATAQNRVCSRLNFRDDHPLRSWVQTEVNRRFRHVCCNDISELQREEYGITRQGLIRDGPTRNIKDDRKKVDDVKNFVLGWSTEGKIQALNNAVGETEREINKALTYIENSKKQQRSAEEKLRASDSVLGVQKFADLDFAADQTRIDSLVHEEVELEESSDKRKALKKQLVLIESRLAAYKSDIEKILDEHGRVGLRLEQNLGAQKTLRQILEPHCEINFQTFAESMESMHSEKTLSLSNVEKIAVEICNSLRGKLNHQTALINSAKTDMVRNMTIFLHAYVEYRARLSDQVEFSSEFVDLMRELERDDLPRHRKRFQEFLSSNLIGDMAMFNTRLEQHESAIRERIEQVNAALHEVPFSPTTRVRIVPKANRSDEVRRFKAELRHCIADGINPSEEDRNRIFGNIRELIEKFGKDPTWTQRVTDARNWFDFGVSEIENTSSREVNYFAASSGKSGGQKTRLAFTILASAIAAQYGLAGFGDQSHTFRLVVIDEAFARTDEENSQLALELFKSLGLQLVIVSPFDAKARIVEDYVDTFHLATNPDRNNSALRRATRADYDAARELRDADAA